MRTSSPGSGHIAALDALRGIAACGVVLAHVPWRYSLSDVAGRNGHLFVDFFFVLSGFVIAFNYGGRIGDFRAAGRFVWLRFWRLYPLHFVMLLVFAAFEAIKWFAATRYGLAAHRAAFAIDTPRAFAAHLFLLQGIGDASAFNGASWSISTEFFAYLVFAGIALAAGRRWLLAAAGVPIAAAIFVALDHGSMNHPEGALAFNRCLFGFFLGVMTFWAASRSAALNRLPPGAAAILCAVAIAAFGAFVSLNSRPQWEFLAPLLSAFAIFALTATPANAVAAALSTRAMNWLGRVSYSTYMIHLAVFWLIAETLRFGLHLPSADTGGEQKYLLILRQPYGDLLVVPALGAILLLSQVTYRWIEAPWRRWSRADVQGAGPAPRGVTNLDQPEPGGRNGQA